MVLRASPLYYATSQPVRRIEKTFPLGSRRIELRVGNEGDRTSLGVDERHGKRRRKQPQKGKSASHHHDGHDGDGCDQWPDPLEKGKSAESIDTASQAPPGRELLHKQRTDADEDSPGGGSGTRKGMLCSLCVSHRFI